ncbi:GDP-fucose protein O-fucosyltransferase [Macleaya cordata]|uniref:O-fucosyltransferase family protein n=1 Tax=Macleaya cordata TaxID=56857 RepID=A0A200PYZ0_MACCD|nr:GDP-fucose protein O-fucosyltransferase [Macleaya cordata]
MARGPLKGYPILSCISDHHQFLTNLKFDRNKFIDSSSKEFWKQSDGLGYRPCLNFSDDYQNLSSRTMKKNRFLMVVVSGGLNQQKIQITDAVVIARILGATLILPVLHVNPIWGDESEFSDIFDDQHFKETLREDVHVLSTLPATHITKRPARASIPLHFDEDWVRTHLMEQINKNSVLLLRQFDSRLSKNLNPDLQKLRCKVAFHALKFKAWIEKLGEKLAVRMSEGRPYMALHLRLEKDVWVRTGCLPGLGEEADHKIEIERASHPELLTGRSNNITAGDRYMAGLCPLNAMEITRLLKAFGASKSTRIYWAGGVPFGGERALEPIRTQYPHLTNKWDLADEEELRPLKNRSSILAALDYIVCLKSHVFMANHGGNMARSLQGHRAYLGHKKHITPNKKQLVHLFVNQKNLGEKEMDEEIRKMHFSSSGSPLMIRPNRDVIAFPFPDCMCTS